jgi:GntR family transcriptional regulator
MAPPPRPVYLRLRDRIAAGIIDGTWPPGALLPSVRTLAAEEGANPLTVAKAYQQFQDEGLVRVQRGIGLFVEPGAAETLRRRGREQFLREEWPLVAERIRLLAIRPEDLPGLPFRADENV